MNQEKDDEKLQRNPLSCIFNAQPYEDDLVDRWAEHTANSESRVFPEEYDDRLNRVRHLILQIDMYFLRP